MSGRQLWQAMPPGWIEFAAHSPSSREAWWDRYLETGAGWLPEDAKQTLTSGFHAGCAYFEGTEYDFAGVAITLTETPFMSFLCTQVRHLSKTDTAPEAAALHGFLPALQFGIDGTSESFRTQDGRLGTVTSALTDTEGQRTAVTIGEVSLPDSAGTVIIVGLCTDPARRDFLALQTAFALGTTMLLADGERPREPEDVGPFLINKAELDA